MLNEPPEWFGEETKPAEYGPWICIGFIEDQDIWLNRDTKEIVTVDQECQYKVLGIYQDDIYRDDICRN